MGRAAVIARRFSTFVKESDSTVTLHTCSSIVCIPYWYTIRGTHGPPEGKAWKGELCVPKFVEAKKSLMKRLCLVMFPLPRETATWFE